METSRGAFPQVGSLKIEVCCRKPAGLISEWWRGCRISIPMHTYFGLGLGGAGHSEGNLKNRVSFTYIAHYITFLEDSHFEENLKSRVQLPYLTHYTKLLGARHSVENLKNRD